MSPLPLLIVPLASIAVTLAFGRWGFVRAIALMGSSAFCLAWSLALALFGDSGPVAMAGWAAPLGIVLRADPLARWFLVSNGFVFTLAAIEALGHEIGPLASTRHQVRELAYGGVLLGLNGLFLTADFFNFYVFFELMTVSAIILVLRGDRQPLEAAWKFAAQSILASLSLLVGIAFIYGMTGALDMNTVAERLDGQTALWTAGLFAFAFLLKAGVFPFHWWLADAHGAASSAGSVVMAGAVINAGIFGLLRFWPLLFGDALTWLFVPIGVATMFVGALAAFRTDDSKRMLGYSSTSQFGFVLLAIGWSAPRFAAVYVFAHALAKSLLFLVIGFAGHATGSYSLSRTSNARLRSPLASYGCLVGFASLVGLPPTVGFVAKLAVLSAGFEHGDATGIALLLAGSLATATYGLRVYQRLFMQGDDAITVDRSMSTIMSQAAIVVATLAVLAGFMFAGKLWSLAGTLVSPDSGATS